MFLQLRVQIIIKFCFHGAGGLISSIVLRGDHPTGIGHPHPPNPMYSPLFTKPFFPLLPSQFSNNTPLSVIFYLTWNMSRIWLISKQHIRTCLNKPFKINNNSDSSAKTLCTFFPSFSSEYCLLDRCALVEVANWYHNVSQLCWGNYSHFSYIWCNTLLISQSLFGLTLTVVTGYDLRSPKSCL